MSSDVYTILFVIEEVHYPSLAPFSLSIRFEGYEWFHIGNFDKSVNKCKKLSSILQESVAARGISLLFDISKPGSVLAVTVATKIGKYYEKKKSPTIKTLTSSIICQTDPILTRSVKIQRGSSKKTKTASSSTEVPLITVEELETVVNETVIKNLKEIEDEMEQKCQDLNNSVESISKKSSQVICESHQKRLGHNIVPRLQRLRTLDKMIHDRARIVERFDSELVRNELARKKEIIQRARSGLSGNRNLAESGCTTLRSIDTNITEGIKKKTRFRNNSFLSSSDITTEIDIKDVSSEESNFDKIGENKTTESESSYSLSSTSENIKSITTENFSNSSSSRETIRRKYPLRSATTSPNEYSFSPIQHLQEEKKLLKTLSPTSLYLHQLREKILREGQVESQS
uniref:SPATA1_C domain-containing protein n=1 Tax=Heterorhabditis bacteriophora TaxID=37862 RepID=A0A1I7XAF2_HETBA